MGVDDEQLRKLVKAAKGPTLPIKDAHRAAVAATVTTSDFTWLTDIVASAEARVLGQNLGDERLWESSLRWSRAYLRDEAPDEEVKATAERHAIAHLVNLGATEWPMECAGVPVTGPGAEALGQGGALMVAFLHTGIAAALLTALPRAAGRLVYSPGGRADEAGFRRRLADRSPSSMVRIRAEHYGLRFVGPERRFDVNQSLLERGQVCQLPADAPGRGEGVLLNRAVRTTTAPVALARLTGAPLVVAGVIWNRFAVELRVSPVLSPDEFRSVASMYSASLEAAEEILREAPEQLLVRFPSLKLAQSLERKRVLTAALARARDAEREARERFQASTESTAKPGSDKPRMAQGTRHLVRDARRDVRDSASERKRLEGDLKRLKSTLRR